MLHVFSDEMVVQLDKNNKYIWVQTRAASVLPAPKFPTKVNLPIFHCSFNNFSIQILIWAAISWRGASKIVILSGETGVDSVVYQEILDAALVPFMRLAKNGPNIKVTISTLQEYLRHFWSLCTRFSSSPCIPDDEEISQEQWNCGKKNKKR